MTSTWGRKSLNRAGSASLDDPFNDASDGEQLDGDALIDLTADDKLGPAQIQQALANVEMPQRNYALDADHQSVGQVAVNGTLYEIGQFVELREVVGIHGNEFLEIKSINVQKKNRGVIIRGIPYARTRNLHGCLPRKKNEVCLVLEVDADDARPDEEQALHEIAPEDIVKKRILINTNKAYPHSRFDPLAYSTPEKIEKEAPLTCRWKMRAEYKDLAQRRTGRLQAQALEHLSERDGQNIKRRNLGVDMERSREWRGETIWGGSTFLAPDSITDEIEDSKTARVQKYSFAEVSAGAGGASRGAEMAGFKVAFATECCHHACDSYRANFPNAVLYKIETAEFATDGDQQAVDLLHIQPWALNTAGDDKDAAQKICTDLLNKSHPRFVSMEQPATILSERKAPFFNAIMQSFTGAGYSIQWKIVQMVDYGLPQARKRVILIGAGPGETLPSWPAATHSLDPTEEQQHLVTEEEAIAGLNPQLHSLHDPEGLPVVDRAPRDADKPMDTAINGSGSGYYHPEGQRDFTIRELASLQGFPTYHQFEGSYLKKQIGNAFPPSVAMAFYQHLRQHMEEVDSVTSGLVDFVEPAENHSVSMTEITIDGTVVSPECDEAPTTPLEATITDSSQDVHGFETPTRSSRRQRTRGPVLPPSPPQTMSPEAPSLAGTMSPVSGTPSPAHQLPTPSTGGRFIAGQRAASLRKKRERAVFEEAAEGDGENDDDGPMALQTPSKRPRTSSRRGRTHAFRPEGSPAVSSSSDNAAGQVEDVPTAEEADKQGGSGLGDENLEDLALALWVQARQGSRYDDEV